jgi:DNA-binding PadR family transcriptional regulator
MNDDMPWVNLTQEEVEELRNKKHELTEYGKQRLKELMNKDLTFKTNGKETFSIPSQTLGNLTLGTKVPETKLEVEKTMDCELHPDDMFE